MNTTYPNSVTTLQYFLSLFVSVAIRRPNPQRKTGISASHLPKPISYSSIMHRVTAVLSITVSAREEA